LDFSLTDEQKMVQQTVRRFVDRELMPLESEVMQSEGKYPTGIEPNLYHSLQEKAKELGFWGINTPEEYGGADVPLFLSPLAEMPTIFSIMAMSSRKNSISFPPLKANANHASH